MTFPLANDLAQLCIDGNWREGSGTPIDVLNPSSNERLFRLLPATDKEVDEAVQAAWRAFRKGEWPKLPGLARGQLLLQLASRIRENTEYLAKLESLNTGIPIRQSRFEVESAARHVEYFAGLAGKVEGSATPLDDNRFVYTIREPLGVIGQSVPWNSPLKLMARGCAATLACGNTLVIKPSVLSCASVLYFGKLVEEAGFPRGVVNIVPGPGSSTGAALIRHPDVRKVVFIGGRDGGREVLAAASQNITPVLIELGGKGPIIVCADVEVEEAVEGVISQAFARSGEVCFAGTRLFIASSIHDKFVARLIERTEAMTVGDALNEDTDIGPLISRSHLNSVAEHVERAVGEGVKIETGGAQRANGKGGNFMRPTLMTKAMQTMRIAQEEVFGPVLPIIKFADLADAVEQANATEYGLAGYVWSNDGRVAHKLARALECGNVFVNTYRYSSEVPFGGYKRSGYGREHGLEALREHTQIKSVLVGLDRWHDQVMSR